MTLDVETVALVVLVGIETARVAASVWRYLCRPKTTLRPVDEQPAIHRLGWFFKRHLHDQHDLGRSDPDVNAEVVHLHRHDPWAG